MTCFRHVASLEFDISTKACKLNSDIMNCFFEKNSWEKDENRASSTALQVRRRLPYSTVVRLDAIWRKISRGIDANWLLTLFAMATIVLAIG